MIQNKPNVIILLLLTLSINLIAQEEFKKTPQEVFKLINKSQELYSIDDEIINGILYPPPDSRIKGHPYLNDDQWNEGTIFIKGKIFANLIIKYDLILDDVILKTKIEDSAPIQLVIHKSKVDSFIRYQYLLIMLRRN